MEAYGFDKTTQETPNTQTCSYKYADGTLLEFECRGRFTNHEGFDGTEVGNLFYGKEGWLQISGDTWKAFRGRERTPFAGSKPVTEANPAPNYANFLDAIRAGNNNALNADIYDGFLSTALPHLANISYRVGRSLKFVGDSEKFADDPEADALRTRIYRIPYVVPEKI